MDDAVNAIALDSVSSGCTTSGSPCIYLGGTFLNAGTVTANRIAKWGGSSWSALGTGMDDSVNTLALDSTGKLYAGGIFTCARNSGVTCVTNAGRFAKWNGSTWSAVGSSTFNDYVSSLKVDSSDNVYAGGVFTASGATSLERIAKWSGSSWSQLDSGIDGAVNAIAFDPSGNVFAAGDFTLTFSSLGRDFIAKWSPSFNLWF